MPPATEAGASVAVLYEFLAEAEDVTLHSGAQAPVAMPPEVLEALRAIVGAMVTGRAVSVAPRETVLTTQQAADLLGVSRPTLVKLLESGRIPFAKPGRHRRIRLEDVMDYQQRTAIARRQVLSDMTREGAEAADERGIDHFVETR